MDAPDAPTSPPSDRPPILPTPSLWPTRGRLGCAKSPPRPIFPPFVFSRAHRSISSSATWPQSTPLLPPLSLLSCQHPGPTRQASSPPPSSSSHRLLHAIPAARPLANSALPGILPLTAHAPPTPEPLPHFPRPQSPSLLSPLTAPSLQRPPPPFLREPLARRSAAPAPISTPFHRALPHSPHSHPNSSPSPLELVCAAIPLSAQANISGEEFSTCHYRSSSADAEFGKTEPSPTVSAEHERHRSTSLAGAEPPHRQVSPPALVADSRASSKV